MPPHGKQRSPLQKLQTAEMRGHGLALRSPSGAPVIHPDPRAASRERQKFVKEARVRQQAAYNDQRQKARLKHKIDDKENVSASLEKIHQGADRSNEGAQFVEVRTQRESSHEQGL